MTRYIIDASSLNDLEDSNPKDIPVFEPIYDKVFEMFDNGELFSVMEVYEELKDSQEFWKDYKHCFRELTEKKTRNISDILCFKDFSVLEKNGNYWSYPHMIACAMDNPDITLITQKEKVDGKIHYDCEKKEIRRINLLEFIKKSVNNYIPLPSAICLSETDF